MPLSSRGCAMADVYELGLFGLFLLKALVGALAGGLIMGALDGLSHIFWDGKVTKKQYLWALGASFVLGLFVQWQGTYQEMEKLKKPQPVAIDEVSRKTIDDLRIKLFEKEGELQEARRLRDRAEDVMAHTEKENSAFRNQLRARDQRIVELQAKQEASKAQASENEQKNEKTKISANRLTSPPGDTAPYETKFVFVPDRDVTPVKISVTCDSEIVQADASIVGASVVIGGSAKTGPNTYLLQITSPVWVKLTPLIVTVKSNKTPINCKF